MMGVDDNPSIYKTSYDVLQRTGYLPHACQLAGLLLSQALMEGSREDRIAFDQKMGAQRALIWPILGRNY